MKFRCSAAQKMMRKINARDSRTAIGACSPAVHVFSDGDGDARSQDKTNPTVHEADHHVSGCHSRALKARFPDTVWLRGGGKADASRAMAATEVLGSAVDSQTKPNSGVVTVAIVLVGTHVDDAKRKSGKTIITTQPPPQMTFLQCYRI
jgi:hypothetical protein